MYCVSSKLTYLPSVNSLRVEKHESPPELEIYTEFRPLRKSADDPSRSTDQGNYRLAMSYFELRGGGFPPELMKEDGSTDGGKGDADHIEYSQLKETVGYCHDSLQMYYKKQGLLR